MAEQHEATQDGGADGQQAGQDQSSMEGQVEGHRGRRLPGADPQGVGTLPNVGQLRAFHTQASGPGYP